MKVKTSWVIRNRETKEVVMETWDIKVAALNTEEYEAVPIRQYLAELSKEVKENE